MDLFKEIEKAKLSYDNFEIEIQNFLASKPNKNKNTAYTYSFALHFFYNYASKRNLEFSLESMTKYKVYLEKSRKMKKYAISTYLTALRQFFEYQLGKDAITQNPLSKVKYKIKNRNKTFEFLNNDQLKTLFNSIQGEEFIELRDRLIIKFIINLNLDENTILNINMGDVEHSKKKITIKLKSKTIDIPKDIFPDAEKYLHLKSFAFANQAFFTSKSNRSMDEPLTKRGLREMIEIRLKKANLTNNSNKISPILLKHTAGVILAKNYTNLDEFMFASNIQSESTAKKYFEAAHKEKN